MNYEYDEIKLPVYDIILLKICGMFFEYFVTYYIEGSGFSLTLSFSVDNRL